MMNIKQTVCQECGEPVSASARAKMFCTPACRQAFNNRRMQRGAELYDLFRALRRERTKAKALNVWTIICQLEKQWHDEDEAKRPGRKSYTPPKRAIANLLDKGSLRRGEILVQDRR